jgi:hypothetical protein
VKKTKKGNILIPTLLVLMFSMVAMPVMAIGPQQAAEVGNNKHLILDEYNDPILDTPSGVHDVWVESTLAFSHWINASKGEGKMNNAVIIDSQSSLIYLLQHPYEYENRWIYFNQYWFAVSLMIGGEPDYLEIASQYPDGIFWHFVYVG